MYVRLLTLALVMLGAILAPANAHAQSLRGTVVLPVRPALRDDGLAQRAADPVEAALARRDPAVISMHEARDRFVARSRAPVGPDEGDVDVLAREARAALEHVAFGRTQAAQKSVKEVMARAERALESLNRETNTARQVLDACLALVRASLHQNDRRKALDQAMACRRLVPDVAPNQSLHPASVIGVLAEADDQLRRLRTGRLRVVSIPESSCSVFVNGRHLGTTPFLLERAVSGTYRVQVECSDERGRVHLVELGDDQVDLRVDAQFDRAMVSEPRLVLRYSSVPMLDALAVDHASQLGRAIRADNAVLVRVEKSEVILSRVLIEQGRLVGRVRLSWSEQTGYDPAALERAIDALWEGRIDAGAAAAPVEVSSAGSQVESPAPEAAAPSAPKRRAVRQPVVVGATAREPEPMMGPSPEASPQSPGNGKTIAGVALSVLGAGALLTGAIFETRAADLDDELASLSLGDPEIDDLQSDFDRARSLRWIGLGGVIAVGAVPLLSKVRQSVPWWSYALTGAGVGLAAVGTYYIVTADECELRAAEGGCIQEKNTEGRGALWLSASVPLLAVLPTHWLMRDPKMGTVALMSLPSGGALLSWRLGL